MVLGLFGFRSEEGGSISEEALRLIVMGASKSGGIEKGEANMVEAVLDLSDTKVSKVMCPRTEVVAIDQVCYWNVLPLVLGKPLEIVGIILFVYVQEGGATYLWLLIFDSPVLLDGSTLPINGDVSVGLMFHINIFLFSTYPSLE